MSIFFRLALSVIILLLLDFYAYQAVRTLSRAVLWPRYLYWILSFGFLALLIYSFLSFDRSSGIHNSLFKFLMGSFVLLVVPKLVLSFGLLAEDITRLLVGLGGKFSGAEQEQFLPARRRFVSQVALLLAALPFAGIVHGIWRGRYNFRVIRKTLYFEDLPEAFDGFSITQISDVHSGSFDRRDKIRYAIDLIRAQKSDLLVFTGDLVNNTADEMDRWKNEFAKLRAPFGQYSILGNHDYGDYVQWPTPEAKIANMEKLFRVHAEIGFDLLRNENRRIEKQGQYINLLGVENWGAGGFAKHGDLNAAAAKVGTTDFNILLSHDPSHFDYQVKNFAKKIQLTLSGHTHGMQFGIEIPGWLKWSPVKYRYPKWAGLYQENGRSLYVNRGFGFLAFPGRVGIWPEITVIELRREKSKA